MRVIVLGAGFAGLELTTRLSDEFGDDLDVLLIDGSDGFVLGFSKLDVMFGRLDVPSVHHPYRDFAKPGVRFVQATVNAIDPAAKRVETTAGTFDADILVVCLGADLDPAATPGLLEGGHEFYTEEGAFALRDVLAAFEGGRVVVAVASAPFKCPPAPSETVLLLHDFLSSRGIRDSSEIALVMPLPLPIPPSPAASTALLAAFEERSIEWHPRTTVRSLDPARRVAVLDDGGEMPYDLFLGVSRHTTLDCRRPNRLFVRRVRRRGAAPPITDEQSPRPRREPRRRQHLMPDIAAVVVRRPRPRHLPAGSRPRRPSPGRRPRRTLDVTRPVNLCSRPGEDPMDAICPADVCLH